MPSNMKHEHSVPSDEDSKPSISDAEFNPSPSPSKKRRVKPESKDKTKAGHAGGRFWTGDEYAALFKLVNDVGKQEAFNTFPGRTRNQAYQAWR